MPSIMLKGVVFVVDSVVFCGSWRVWEGFGGQKYDRGPASELNSK